MPARDQSVGRNARALRRDARNNSNDGSSSSTTPSVASSRSSRSYAGTPLTSRIRTENDIYTRNNEAADAGLPSSTTRTKKDKKCLPSCKINTVLKCLLVTPYLLFFFYVVIAIHSNFAETPSLLVPSREWLENLWERYQRAEPIKNVVQDILVIFVLPIYSWIKLSEQDPREHIISVQINIIHRKEHEGDEGNTYTSNTVDYCNIQEQPAADKAFQEILEKARAKPRALVGKYPTLNILDIGPYEYSSLAWVCLDALTGKAMVDPTVVVKGASGMKLQSIRFYACLTFGGYSRNTTKMRLLVASKKQLSMLYNDSPLGPFVNELREEEYEGKHKDQRLNQLKELATHIAETGGFESDRAQDANASVRKKIKIKKNSRIPKKCSRIRSRIRTRKNDKQRYYFEIEIWRPQSEDLNDVEYDIT